MALPAKNSTLDRVKRLQERAGFSMDVKDRILDRRDRCSAALHQRRSLGGYNNIVQRFKGVGFESMLAEKPMRLEVDAKYEGVLKISDRSFCENGEWNVCIV